jgi:hypothetical protein
MSEFGEKKKSKPLQAVAVLKIAQHIVVYPCHIEYSAIDLLLYVQFQCCRRVVAYR